MRSFLSEQFQILARLPDTCQCSSCCAEPGSSPGPSHISAGGYPGNSVSKPFLPLSLAMVNLKLTDVLKAAPLTVNQN